MGRPSLISRADVVRVAEAMQPEDVSVSAVAHELGVSRAAVYRYVSGSDELRRLSVRANVSDANFASEGIEDWREWLFAFAVGLRAWRFDNPHAKIEQDLSPRYLEEGGIPVEIERGLGLLVDAGFDFEHAAAAAHFISGIVWSNTADELMARADPEGLHPLIVRDDQKFSADGRLPRTLGMHGVFADPQARFEREIRWAIRGIERDLPHNGIG